MSVQVISQKNFVLLASKAIKTTTGNTPLQIGLHGCKGAIFFVNVSAKTGTPTYIVWYLEVYDIASNTWNTLYTHAPITTISMNVNIVYPNASGAIYQVLPDNWRIRWTSGGADNSDYFTMSIGVTYLP